MRAFAWTRNKKGAFSSSHSAFRFLTLAFFGVLWETWKSCNQTAPSLLLSSPCVVSNTRHHEPKLPVPRATLRHQDIDFYSFILLQLSMPRFDKRGSFYYFSTILALPMSGVSSPRYYLVPYLWPRNYFPDPQMPRDLQIALHPFPCNFPRRIAHAPHRSWLRLTIHLGRHRLRNGAGPATHNHQAPARQTRRDDGPIAEAATTTIPRRETPLDLPRHDDGAPYQPLVQAPARGPNRPLLDAPRDGASPRARPREHPHRPIARGRNPSRRSPSRHSSSQHLPRRRSSSPRR